MLALLALGLPALAFSPDADTFIGVEPERIIRTHVEVQHRLRNGDAWQGFLDGEGAGWTAVFDERTGLARSAWGPGIPLGQLQTAQEVDAALMAFFSRNEALIGVPADQLALRAVAGDGDTWTVQLSHVVDGPQADAGDQPVLGGDIDLSVDVSIDPFGNGGGLADEAEFDFTPSLSAQGAAVWRGGVKLRIANGQLIWMSVQTHPDAAQVDNTATLSAATAIEVAVSDGPEPGVDHEPLGARLVVLPMEKWGLGTETATGSTGTGLDYRLVWETRTATITPAGHWVSFVDAHSGELLWVYNEVRYASGTVYGYHDLRTVDGNFATSPMVSLSLDGDAGDSTYSGDEGTYDLTASAVVDAELDGSRLRVRNQAGDEASATFSGDFTWTDDYGTQAEIDTWVFLHQVMEWRDAYASEVSTGGTLTSNVNINSSCNAYFDGSVNFYQAGSGCNNTGRIADVNYHEWGHGFHYYSLESGSFDGSMSEGIADVVSFFLTNDAVIAPYFMTNGSGIRNAATNYVYPDDVTGEVHQDGLIYAGAIWDLWELLEEDNDEAGAYDIAVKIFKDGIKPGPTLAEAYDAAILGDDDNGNLDDGTPNQCAIIEAFGAHGLGAGGSTSLIAMSHEPLENQTADATEYELSADIVNLAPECIDFDLDTAVVAYSIDGGDTWEYDDLDNDHELVFGSIPAQAPGTVVHYFLAGEGADDTEVFAPSGGEINPFSFVVGDLVEIYCEDFETDEGGFEHLLLDGRDELGADDWVWGTPQGMGGDPDFAYSGDNVWGNDLGGGNYNGEYQNSKHNRLKTPAIDVSGHDQVILQFRRWLNVEDGYWDDALIVLAGEDEDSSNDDVIVWSNYASSGGSSSDHDSHHEDAQWALHSLQIDVAKLDEMRVGWDILSDSGLTFGGWNIDDVCVYAISDGSGAGGSDGGSADGGTDAGDAGDGGDEWDVKARGCGCASAPGGAMPGAIALGLLSLGVVLRRRRR